MNNGESGKARVVPAATAGEALDGGDKQAADDSQAESEEQSEGSSNDGMLTKENFANIAGLISPDAPVVMISSNYHMDRAVRNASENGFTHVMRLPAPSRFFSFGANMLSEVVLDLNELTAKKQPLQEEKQ